MTGRTCVLPGSTLARGRPITRPSRRRAVLLAGPEHATRERPGVLALLQHDLAADDHVMDTFGALHPAWRARRAVVGDLVVLDADRREIEHHEVGRESFADHPTIAEPHDAGGLEGEPADGVLER